MTVPTAQREYRFLLSCLFGLFLCLFPHLSSAQTAGLGVPETLSIQVSPEAPRPGGSVLITVTSSSLDIDRSTITWSKNGVVDSSGAGLKQYRFTAGALGSATTIGVSISFGGQGAEKTLTIRPELVDLIWESDGYTGPFYRGKSPAAPGSALRFVALPHLLATPGSGEVPQADAIYRWSKNGTVLGSLSGAGKNTLSINAPTTGSMVVKVEASSPDGALQAISTEVVTTSAPLIRFYEDDPLLGLRLDRTIKSPFNFSKSEARILAVPFFFSAASPVDANLSYRWSAGSTPVVVSPAEKDAIVLSAGSGGGSVSLNLIIDHALAFMQSASQSLSATQDASPSSRSILP